MKSFLGLLIFVLASITSAEEAPSTVGKLPSVPDDWKLLEGRHQNGQITFYRKNMGIGNIAGHKGLPIFVFFTIKYNPDSKTGLPSVKDQDRFEKFNSEVVTAVKKETLVAHVATATGAGKKDFLFYVSDPKSFLGALNRHREVLKGFEIAIEKGSDPEWKQYQSFPGGNDYPASEKRGGDGQSTARSESK